MPTDDRKSNESEKSASRPQDDSTIRDLPDQKDVDQEEQDQKVKGGRIPLRDDSY